MPIQGLLELWKTFGKKYGGDQIDRYHFIYTSNLLIVFASISAFKTFGSDPINCLVPGSFPNSWQAVSFIIK
ncbi:Innexin family-containing protein [Strongyloides ratti]|uniref:Innexin family-containing protein n=1 Tax=Strongyloides ratti TaxID=34506 RepID=A0A090L092_STRRB|nr:Innexin family-containing protein [Strongyloides ratti]CEF60914.1 Innexin family-containing protein [Strongyloides ratti]